MMVNFRRYPRSNNRRVVPGCNQIRSVSTDPNSQGLIPQFRVGGPPERAKKPERNHSKQN
jgi:hypothetical protein